MGEGVRTQLGSTLPLGEGQSAPGPERDADEESMSTGMRELLVGWGGKVEPRESDERLAALRRGRLHEA